MKKILLILMILAGFLLASCEPDPDYPMFYHNMVELDTPEEVNGYWVSHTYVLNKEETIYYAPKILRTDTETYINDQEIYFVQKPNKKLLGPDFIYEELTIEILKEIWYNE